ncbi:MAG TPA: hypothetical protein VEC19_00510 [Usitatibacter sp.]|nr:hypothetical protein [Usitatibacter sp.]
MARHFVYLTNTRLVSMATRGRSIQQRREFAVSGAGAEEFQRHLATLKSAPTHILTDLAEEDFRLDTVPHVGQGDREAIFARRLAQIYRNTPYRNAVLQGREADGRRDDRVLYTAVTNPEVLRPWVDAIERLKVPLRGIHSSAVFSAALLEELDLEFAHTLLVTITPGDALRQTYFRDGEFKFSRLTPLDFEEGQTLGSLMAEETTRTWQYLDSLRHFGADDRLEVCVIVHPSERAALEPQLRGFAQIQYRVLDIEQVAAKLALKPPPLGSSAEEVLVHLFLMHPVENHYASPEQRRFSSLRSARNAINAVSVAVLATSIAWGGYNLYRVFRSLDADQALTRQVTALNREYDEITRSLPTLGIGGATMRDAVTFYNGSLKPFPLMSDFLAELSEVLLRQPDVRVNQLAWQASDDPKASPLLPPTPAKVAPPVKAVAKAGEPTAPPVPADDAVNPVFAGGRYEVALLEATVRVAPNDFRGALDTVESLASEISKRKGFTAQIVDSPLDTRSSFALQGRLADRDAESMEPRFVLRVVRDRGAPA